MLYSLHLFFLYGVFSYFSSLMGFFRLFFLRTWDTFISPIAHCCHFYFSFLFSLHLFLSPVPHWVDFFTPLIFECAPANLIPVFHLCSSFHLLSHLVGRVFPKDALFTSSFSWLVFDMIISLRLLSFMGFIWGCLPSFPEHGTNLFLSSHMLVFLSFHLFSHCTCFGHLFPTTLTFDSTCFGMCTR